MPKVFETFEEFISEGLVRVILDKDIEDDLYDNHGQFFDGPAVDDYSGNEMMVGNMAAAEKYLKANKIKYKIQEARINETGMNDVDDVNNVKEFTSELEFFVKQGIESAYKAGELGAGSNYGDADGHEFSKSTSKGNVVIKVPVYKMEDGAPRPEELDSAEFEVVITLKPLYKKIK